ncbi:MULTISPECIES: DUF3040 domain-containing protein [unclassified Actinoplanes]|uniref:DUF3040 domain-containing protein n=1 Tax=unclassified Actinoplanes TaxID=2626549 RepID=UPI0012FC3872|nr:MULTISPECIES: DUF3040 domain-containing protein [unclassified Actinoplanes]
MAGVLEEKDRRALAEIENELTVADPGFARRMRRGDGELPAVAASCVLAFLAMPFTALLFGPAAVLVVVNIAIAVIMLVVASR